MSRWLIFGGGGFVASHLIDLLIDKGEDIYTTVRWNEDLNRISHTKGKVNLIEADMTDFISILRSIEESKAEYISILAAESYVNSSFVRPHSTFLANGIGTLNVLEAIKYLREKEGYDPIIHVCSSSEVYGLVDKNHTPIKETQPFNPSNPYAVSKVATDMLGLMYYTNYGMKTIRTRFFTHTGPRRTMLSAECNFAKQIALIEKGKQEPILKHGNLESIRTWADVRDAVRGYYLLSQKGKYGDVYNIGGNTVKTVGETLNTLLSFSNMKDKIKLEQDRTLMRPYDVTLQIPDITKFKNVTGWEPKISFDKTMCDLLNDWRERV